MVADPARLAQRLTEALRQRDESAFVDGFAAGATSRAIGRSWYAVLGAGEAVIADAGAGRFRVTYRLPGDRRSAVEVVAYQPAAGSDRIGWVGPVGGALPLWSLPGATVTRAGSGAVVSGALDTPARAAWAARLDAAAEAVRAARLGGVDDIRGSSNDAGWDGGLVVQVPPEGRFGEVTGEPATNASAVTSCTAGTPRVVVNPVILGQAEEWLHSTLVHEAVHVATDSACGTTGASLHWVVEGLAESVAARADRSTAARNRRLVLTYLREHDVPDALPQQVGSLTDYALAALAVDQVRRHLGDGAPDFLRRGIHDPGSLPATELRRANRWYVEELRRLARSA